jgi:hypothetical protein
MGLDDQSEAIREERGGVGHQGTSRLFISGEGTGIMHGEPRGDAAAEDTGPLFAELLSELLEIDADRIRGWHRDPEGHRRGGQDRLGLGNRGRLRVDRGRGDGGGHRVRSRGLDRHHRLDDHRSRFNSRDSIIGHHEVVETGRDERENQHHDEDSTA